MTATPLRSRYIKSDKATVENMQLSDQSATTPSGISEIPDLLSYPKILSLTEIEDEIKGQFVYVIRGYKEEGLSVVIKRGNSKNDEYIYLKIGDFDGRDIDLTDESHPLQPAALFFAEQASADFVEMMRILKIPQMLLYISINDMTIDEEGNYEAEWKLVDLRTSLNKFYGPGMIKDLFSQVFPTQEVIKTTNVTAEVLSTIYKNEGSYKGDLILKCSKFKTVTRGKEMLPLYASIYRK